MPTFKAVVMKNKIRQDGTWNVKIRVTHSTISYISTDYYVLKKQLTKNLDIKDPYLSDRLNATIANYREEIVKLGRNVELYSAKELAEYLVRKTTPGTDTEIDFLEFADLHIEKLKQKDKKRTADNLKTTVNSLSDFFGSKKIPFSKITAKNLEAFDEYLRTKRKIVRPGKDGNPVEYIREPVGDVGVINYMTNIRTIFNAARKHYNNEDLNEIRIAHYPFSTYIIKAAPATKKRNIKPDDIKLIRDTPDLEVHGSHGTNRATLGRDVFMLSFYLVGMNTVDLYNIDQFTDGRLTYKRSKTAGRRSDEALISIKVEPEAIPLLEKYKDRHGKRVFDFYNMYHNEQSFNKAANIGLKVIAAHNGLSDELTLYYARHSWATIGRNMCRISKDDIAMALNHSSSDHKVTDIYIEKDWTIIDEANRKVLDTLK